jgi:xylulokinase
VTYLGVDLGTSGLRALLVDESGTPIATIERAYQTQTPHQGWSEQDPQLWIDALESAVSEMRDSVSEFAALKGIGVAGHMHGATILDEQGNVLRPCILWNDTRAHAEAAALDIQAEVKSLSGNIVFPGFTAPKLEWLREHEPEVYQQIAKVVLPAAYLNFYLTGEFVADMSDSAGTSWLDVRKRDWSLLLLDASHMQLDQMPRLVEGSQKAGILRHELRRKWGLEEPVAVAGGAGDNAAAACGVGALHEGQGFVSLGTSGVILTARDHCQPNPEMAVHTFCHAIPDHWYQMGVMLAATDSLNWLARVTDKTPAELTAALGTTLTPPGAVLFLPYLSGERTPHNDAAIRGSFTGISAQTSRDDLTKAVLEGVAFGLKDSFEALGASGADVDSLIAIGGGARSDYWLKLIATVLNTPLHVPEQGEFGAALGAARLGMVAATGKTPSEVMTPPKIKRVIQPEQSLIKDFEAAYQRFRKAYPAIKSLS